MKKFRRIHLFIVLSLLVFTFFIFSLWQNRQRNLSTRGWVYHSYEVINDINKIEGTVRGAEADARSFFFTKDSVYFRKSIEATNDILPQLKELEQLTADNPQQQTNLQRLRSLVSEEVSAGTMLRNRTKNILPGTSLQELIAADIVNMRTIEEQLLKKRIQDNQNVTLRNLITNAGSMVLAFSALLVMLLQIDRDYLARRRSETNMRAFLSSTSEGFYMISRDYQVEMMNDSARDLFKEGYGITLKSGQNIFDAIPAERKGYILDVFNKVIQGQNIEYESSTNFGEQRWFHANYSPVRDDEGVIGVSVVFRDITDHVLNRQGLIAARNKAEAAEKSQEEFLANMSHEIRTPMNGIIGMTEIMERTPMNDQQKEFLAVIKVSADHLMELINDVLDFSKIKAGKLSIDPVSFNLHQRIEQALSTLQSRADQKGLSLSVNVDSKIPAWLYGDPHRLQQVLINLISNAIKFTAVGSVALNVELIGVNDDEVTIRFAVQDTGIGIEKENIKKIFESFAQAENNTAIQFGGTGLGLTISKRLVELQGGSIDVKSEPGTGSEFSFTIPYTMVMQDGEIEAKEGISMNPFPGKKVLIVEDNVMNQIVLRQYLKNLEVQTETANNGQIAVDMLATNNHFDLIILDLRMPVMDGFKTALYIREQMDLSTPIIAFTASALRSEKERCLALGMNEYLTKPFKGEDLYLQLRKYLS
jgi:PAS domain S-box-containing protein